MSDIGLLFLVHVALAFFHASLLGSMRGSKEVHEKLSCATKKECLP